MNLIIGLGNPGKKYEKTRHNLGFMVADELLRKLTPVEKAKWRLSQKFNSQFMSYRSKFVLAKPQTMMNNSGKAVAKLVNFYQIEPVEIWIIHDDLDLPLGKIKIRRGGGPGGHRGVDSIIKELETDDFIRFRLGIGRPGPGSSDQEVERYVLSPFGRGEKDEARRMVKKTVRAIEVALDLGLERAMNQFNQ